MQNKTNEMEEPSHHKQRFEDIEASMVGAQLGTKRDDGLSSFSSSYSYAQPKQNNQKESKDEKTIQVRRVEEADQVSIFDAAKYLSGLHDEIRHSHPSPTPKVILQLASMSRPSSSINYRARSFHATPTASSSEASWNTQTGLLSNPPPSFGIKINTSNNGKASVNSTKWQRVNPKWFILCRKCPCSGKKSVRVEERIKSMTPRMVDLRRSYSSDDTHYSSSLYCTKLKTPQKPTPTTISLPVVPLPQVQDPSNAKYGGGGGPNNLINKHNMHSNGLSKSLVPIPMKLISTSTNTTTTTTNTASSGINLLLAKASTVANGGTTPSNGFTFPILEDEPISVEKMFYNVTAPQNNNQIEPNRESLEGYQPKSHVSSRSRRASYEEDNVSDGSSDLFEIESFPTMNYPEANVGGNYYSSAKRFGVIKPISRNSLDENQECYAPSEVSIDWSVTTAEGFDKASFSSFSVSASEIGLGGSGGGGCSGGGSENGSGSSGGGLLSCRCTEKPVSVGPGPMKCMIEDGPPIAARHLGGGPPQQVGGVERNVYDSGENGKASGIN